MSRGAQLAASLAAAGFSGRLCADEPLAGYTTWRIGGPAELLAVPRDEHDVRVALSWSAHEGIPRRVMGNGSNLLVRDTGVTGLVLRIRKALDGVAVDDARVRAGAGASFPAVARIAARAGLAGLEFAAGIPGTVGGAVVMNAGWHEFETGRSIERVRVLHVDGSEERVDRDACAFGYRHSAFRDRDDIVVGADFVLQADDRKAIEARLEAFAASRKANQPTELPSCGSVFLKPPGDYAGRLIEAAGLKGARVGDIQVSTKHANFFVNLGNAGSEDLLELVERVERTVADRFGVRLVREFEIW